MKRRDFILLAGAGVGAASATYYFFGDVAYDPALAQPQSLSLIWDAEAIDTIGKQYRKDFPSENNERSLVKLLSTSSTIEGAVTSDFKTGNMVIVDGWILSVTEARQCALASTKK